MGFEVFKAFLHESVQALTAEQVQTFAGGQMEVQNQVEGYIVRGEIHDLRLNRTEQDGKLDNIELEVNFNWVVRAGFNVLPVGNWLEEENRHYSTTLFNSTARMDDNKRLIIVSQITNELIVFYPPGYSDFNPLRK